MAQKKRERIKDRRLNAADKIIAATLAASTILSPLSAAASELTPHEGYGTTVTTNGTKHTVTTTKQNGDKAFNRFTKFELDQGHIANMILPNGTNKLYNFVDGPNMINIQGVVNALKAETRRLGGHLIFISPKGMIIGEQGAINAGKFSAIIADDATYKSISEAGSPWDKTEFQRMEAGYVALNPEGSIVVKGRVTAPGGITLKAAQIKTEAGAKLDTKTLDFNSLVNVGSLDQEYFDATKENGKYKNLILTRNEAGDGSVRLEAIGVPSGDKSEALIEHAGSIDAVGPVVMHARAGGSEYNIDLASSDQNPFSAASVKNKVAVKAKVAVKQGATVSADKNIVVSADVWNFRVDPAFATGVISIDKTIFPTLSNEKFDGSYTDLSADAEVVIEYGAKLTASEDLTLHAESTVGVIAGKSASFLDLVNWPTGTKDKIPAAAVIVSKQSGSAKVTVSGDLRAGGDIMIGATAALTTELNAVATSHDQNQPPVALLWAELENNAAVTVDASADVKAVGALSIDSSVVNSITTQASSKAQGGVPGGTALNATIVATGAQTTVAATLTAGGNVTITAADTTDTWSVSATNRTGTAELYEQKLPTKVTPATFKKVYKHLQDKVDLADMYRYGGGSDGDYEESADKWGFSVLYTGVRSTDTPTQLSSVAIGPGVNVVTSGDIKISSTAVVEDYHWITRSEVGGSNFDEDALKDTFSYAVTYGSPMMASAVNVAPLANLISTAGSIDIESSARVEWDRVGRIIGKLKEDWNNVKNNFTDLSAWEAAANVISSDFSKTDIKNWQGFKEYAQKIGTVLLKTGVYMTATQFASLIPDVMSFADLSSYANVYSQSMAATKEGGQYSNFENAGSGSFAWPNWIVSNALDIYSGATLAAKGSLKVNGSTRSDMALLGGLNNNILGGDVANMRSYDVAVGGAILLDSFTTENNVNVHRGAKLLSSADLTTATDGSSMQLVVNLIGAKPGEKGIDGQLNVLVHSHADRVNIDDEATLSAPRITIKSEAENYVTNVALAYQSKQKSFGFAAGIDVLNFENTARVADFDEAFSDDVSLFTVAGDYIAANSLDVGAFTHAHVNTIAAAGSGAYAPASGDGTHWYDTLNKIPDLPIKGGKKLSEWVGTKITGTATKQEQSENGEGNGGSSSTTSNDHENAPENANIEDAANAGLNKAGDDIISQIVKSISSDLSSVLDDADDDDDEEREQHTLNLAVAGSVAWNFADYTTHAGLQGGEEHTLTIKSYAENETGSTSGASHRNRAIRIESQADKWQAAFTGAAAVSLVNDHEEEGVKAVGVAGAVSVNSGKSIVSADLGNAALVALNGSHGADRDAVAISAGSTGRSVAAALGFDLASGSHERDISVAANVSVNTLNNIVHSTVAGVTTSTDSVSLPVSTDLDVFSYAKDTQVTGGIDVGVAKGEGASGAVGAGVQVAVVKNDLASSVESSTLNNLGAVSIDSYLGVTQVVAGVAVGVGTGHGQGDWAGVGSIVVDTLINKAAANVKSSDITASGRVHIAAGDGADIGARLQQNKETTSFDLEVQRSGAAIGEIISSDTYHRGAELETENYYQKFIIDDDDDDDTPAPADGDTKFVDDELSGRTGMTVVTAALSGAGSDGIVSVGTAVVVNNLRNTMGITVENSSISAGSLIANSENGTALIGVAAGASVTVGSEKGAAANGSVVWNSIVNKADTTFKNADITITGTSLSSLTAQNRALSVGVAGAAGLNFSGNGMAFGFSLGYSHVTNDAVVSVTGGAKKNLTATKAGTLSAHAENSANSWLVAAAAGYSVKGSGSGTGSLHRITGETSSVFDGMTVKGLSGLSITAGETSKARTLSGAVSISAKHVAAGAAIAWTQLGVVNPDKDEYTLHAGLKNSTVEMAPNRTGKLDVSTSDDASIHTVSIGGGFGFIFSANAVVAVNQLHRRDLSEISAASVTGTSTDVFARALKNADLKNISVVIPAGSTGMGGGSVNVNRIGDEDLVRITGTNVSTPLLDIGSLYSMANSGVKILNVGVGGGGAGTGAGAGIVIVNSMSPSTDITIEGVAVRAQNSLAALTMSDAEIRNYGLAGVGAGLGAGVGLVEVNYINDTTTTHVKNASLSALGNGSVVVSDDIDDDHVDNRNLSEYLPKPGETDRKEADADEFAQRLNSKKAPSKRAIYDNAFQGMFDPKPLREQGAANTYNGLVIDASSTHVLTDAVLVGGGAGTGFGGGQVNVDLLTGSTSATVVDSDLASSGDAKVIAADFSNVSGVFFMGGGAGMGAGTGIVNVRSPKREVEASIRSSNLDNKHTLNVTGTAAAGAVSKQSLTTFALVGTGAGMGAGSLLVEVDVQRGATTGVINGMQGSVGGLSATAEHFNRIGQIEIAGAGSMGAGAILVEVGVDKSVTDAEVQNVDLDVTGQGGVLIDAKNLNKGYSVIVTGAGGMGAGAIGVGVNRNSARVNAALKDSRLGSETQRAGNVVIESHNTADLLTVAATAAGGVGGGNILVNVENLNSNIAIDVSNSRVYAHNIAISADEDYKLRSHAWGASGGVGAGLVYVQVMNVGRDDPYSDPMYTSQLDEISASQAAALAKAQKFVSGESGVVNSNVLSPSEAKAVREARSKDIDIRESEDSQMYIAIDAGSVLDASGNITVGGVESTDIISYQGGFTGGVGAGAVNLSFLTMRKQSGIVIDTAKLSAGGTISISSTLTGDNNQHVIQGIGGVGTLFAAYGRLKAFSASTITAKSSDITGAQGVSLSALDTTIHETYGAGGTLAGGSIGGIVARTIVSDDVWVTFDGGKLQSAGGNVALSAKRGGETYAQEVFGYLTGVAGLGADAKASESTNVSVSVGKTDHADVSADTFAVHSELNPYVHAKVHEHGGGGLTVGVPLSEAVVDGSSTVTMGANNRYTAPVITIEAFVGDANAPMRLLADTNGHGGSVGIDFQYGRSEVKNDTTAKLIMNGGTFSGNAALNLHAWNNAALSADVRAIRIGAGVAASSSVGRVYNFGKAAIDLRGSGEIENMLGSLNALAESTSDSRIKVDGDGGGSLALGKPAWSVTSIDNKATVDIAGAWLVSGDMNLNARQSAKTDDWTDAVIGGAIAGNRNTHDLLLNGLARITVAQDAGLYAGGALKIEAENVLVDNPQNHYNVSGNTYGAVAGNGSGNDIVIRQSADITIGKSADVSGYASTTLIAHSSSDIKEYSRVVSGGVGAGSGAGLDFDGTWSNTITIESDAFVGHYGLHPADVNIAAWNDADLRLTAVGNLQAGLVGGATSKVKARVVRNNTITVRGNVLSDQDINIRAGRRVDGFGGELKMTDISQAYAHAIGGAGASAEHDVTQYNIVTIAPGAYMGSTRDTNILTRAGHVTIAEFAERYALTGASKKMGSLVSTARGDAVTNLTNNGKVTVDGTVEAGAKSRFTLNISDGFAVLEKSGDEYQMMKWTPDGKLYVKSDDNGAYSQGKSNDYDYVINGYSNIKTPVITSEGFGYYELGQEDEYDSYLYARLASLDVLMGQAEDTSSAAYQSYVAEKMQIESTLQSYGLPTSRDAASSRSASLIVPYLWLSPITVSGGNITIEADTLDGASTGKMTANGSPKIEITNASNLSVVLSGLNILAPGGEVFVNSVSVSDDNDLRTRVAAASGYGGTVKAEAGDGASPDITVINSYSNPYVEFTMSSKSGDMVDQPVKYTVVTDIENRSIENTGGIINYPGRITLSTSVGSIRSVGADIIAGKGIDLHAPRGSISISSQGILHINSAPEGPTWGAKLLSHISPLDAKRMTNVLSIDVYPASTLFADDVFNATPGNIVSGGNIFITAGVINVNGTIQSGFGVYSLDLGADLAGTITDWNSDWSGSTISDLPSDLAGYQLTSRDIRYDAARDEFVYGLASWYNPNTKRIVVEDIVGTGGTIYLTGKIINTNFWDGIGVEIPDDYKGLAAQNSGRIIAYTGAAEVEINSELDTTLRLGRMDSRSNAAKIVINDTGKVASENAGKVESGFKTTEYTYKDGLLYVSDDYSVTSYNTGTAQYNPALGLYYFFSAERKSQIGQTVIASKYFEDQEDAPTEPDIHHSNYNAQDPVESANSVSVTLSPGGFVMTMYEYFSQDGSTAIPVIDEKALVRFSLKSADTYPDDEWWREGKGTWSKTVFKPEYEGAGIQSVSGTQCWEGYHNWIAHVTVTEALKADNPINVSVRRSANAGNITVTAPNADVLLADELHTNEAGAVVSITAKNIIAAERALVNADDVRLTASENIGENRTLTLDPIGDVVSVAATAGDGKKISLAVPDGGASVDLKATGGTIDLTTDLSIAGKAEAGAITLKSDFGSIGSADTAFAIAGTGTTELTADARETINIAKTNGDLAVVRVETQGDVTLETKGGSIVTPNQTKKSGMTDEEWIQFWQDAGLISADGTSITAQAREELIAGLENVYRTELSTYQMAKAQIASADAGQLTLSDAHRAYLGQVIASLDKYANVTNVSDYQAQLASVDVQLASAELTEKQRAALQKQKEDLQAKITALSQDGTIDIKDYIEQQKMVASSDLNVLDAIDAAAVGGWTKNYLLYAVQDSILNPSPGTVQAELEPLIIGKTVTLKSSVNIGSEDTQETIQGGETLNEDERLEDLKKLASANPFDVTWVDEGDSGYFVINETHLVAIDAAEAAGAKAGNTIAIASPKRDLLLTSVESTGGGKVLLMAGGNVLVSDSSASLTDGSAVVKGGDMSIAAAGQNVDIGSADRPLTVEQAPNSTLRASVGRSVYLTAVAGDLSLGSIAAKQDLFVTTTEEGKSILMSEGQGRLDAADIRLTTNGGSIGSQDAPIRVQNAESNDFARSVTVSGADNVYLNGENNLLDNGWLNLNGASVGSADIRSEGGIAVSGDMTVRTDSLAQFVASTDIIVSHKLTGGDLLLSADENVTVKGETSGDAVTIRSGLNTTLADVKADGLTVNAYGAITTGAVTANHADLTASGDVNANGALTGGTIRLTSQNAAANVSGDVSADTFTVTAHDTVELKKNVTVADTLALQSTSGDVIVGDNIKTRRLFADAYGSVEAQQITVSEAQIKALNNITVSGDMTGGDLKLSADQNVTVGGTTSADELIIRSGADMKLAAVKGTSVDLTGANIILSQDLTAGTLTANAASDFTAQANVTADSADIITGQSIDISGKLTGGDLYLSADQYVRVSGTTSADTLTITSGADTTLADVQAQTLTANAVGSIETKDVTATAANLAASDDVAVDGKLTGGDLELAAGKSVTVADATSADTLAITSGADMTLADVQAQTLTANAGGSIATQNVTATAANLAASDDVAVDGKLTGGDLELAAGKNVTVADTASADMLTITSGADTTLAEVKGVSVDLIGEGIVLSDDLTAGTLTANAGRDFTAQKNVTAGSGDIIAGRSIDIFGQLTGGDLNLFADQNVTVADTTSADTLTITSGADMTLAEVKADSADIIAGQNIDISGNLTGGDLNLSADRNVTVSNTTSADTLTITSGADTTLADVKAENMTANAGGSIATQNVTATAANMAASDDVSVDGTLTGGDLELTAGKNVTVADVTSTDKLAITSGADTTLTEVMAETLTANAGGDFTAQKNVTAVSADIIASHDIAVSGDLTGGKLSLSADENVTVSGTTSADELTIRSGADTTLADVKAQTLTANAGGTIATQNLTAETASMTASHDVTVDGTLTGGDLNLSADQYVTVGGTTSADTLTIKSGADTTLADVKAETLTANAGGSLMTDAITAQTADLTASVDVTAKGAINADTLNVAAGNDISTQNVTVATAANLVASNDITVDGKLTGGSLDLTAGKNISVTDTTSADTLTVRSGSNTKLAEVKGVSVDLTGENIVVSQDLTAGTLTANAAQDFTAQKNVTANSGDIIAGSDITVSGSLTGGSLNLSADENVTVGGTTSADTLIITSGADTTLADVKSSKLTANAGGSIATKNVTAETANMTASDDVTVDGKLTGGDLELAAGKNVTVTDTTSADTLTITSGADTTLADVQTGTLTANAGGSIATKDVTATAATMNASDDVTVNGTLTGGDLALAAGKNVSVADATSADKLAITSGADTTLANVKAETLTAKAGGSIATQNVTATAANLTASGNVTVQADLTGGELNLSAGKDLTVVGTTSADTLTATAGKDAEFAQVRTPLANVTAGKRALMTDENNDMDVLNLSASTAVVRDSNDLTLNVQRMGNLDAATNGDLTATFAQAANDVSLTSRGGTVDILSDVSAHDLSVSAKESVRARQNITATDSVTLASSGDVTVAGTVTTKDLNATGGEKVTFAGPIAAAGDVDLTSLNASARAEKDIAAQNLSIAAKESVSVLGSIDVTDETALVSSNDITADSAVKTGSLNVTAGKNATIASALVRDDLTGYAGEALTMRGDSEVGGNAWLSAHEISMRSLTAGKKLTALSETTFTGDDLTAGDDVRVHTYGDMTFNDVKAGDNAWILGLGSSALRMKFHSVSAPGLDTAVLVERGYLDYWKVTAGLDGAAAVRYFEGPKVFGTLEQGSKIRVFFPFGGSLMPKDPFHFHVIDLLQNIHLLPFEREAVRMWPPRKPNLHVGSDDIDVYLDDYEYWLLDEPKNGTELNEPLTVGKK